MQGEDFALMPIDLTICNGRYFVVLAKLPRKSQRPFFLDSLLHKFHLADVDKNKSDEQNVLVRRFIMTKNDPRIDFVPLVTFQSL